MRSRIDRREQAINRKDKAEMQDVQGALVSNRCPNCGKQHREGTQTLIKCAEALTAANYSGYDYDTESWVITPTTADYTNQEEKYENVQYRNIFLMLASWGISSNIAGNAVSLAINTSSVSFRHGEHIISITYSDHFFTVIKDK